MARGAVVVVRRGDDIVSASDDVVVVDDGQPAGVEAGHLGGRRGTYAFFHRRPRSGDVALALDGRSKTNPNITTARAAVVTMTRPFDDDGNERESVFVAIVVSIDRRTTTVSGPTTWDDGPLTARR